MNAKNRSASVSAVKATNVSGGDELMRQGKWEILPYESQIEAVHMALLHTGKVLFYSGFRKYEAVDTETRVWYPKTGEIKKPFTPGDIFCAGHSFLPDGRLLSTGGTLEYRDLPPIPPWLARLLRPIVPFLIKVFAKLFTSKGGPSFTGPTFLYLFDPLKEQWEFAGDMREGRWYPTNITLPDGTILIISGLNEGKGFGSRGLIKTNMRMEVYDPKNGIREVAVIPPETDTHEPGIRGREEPAFPSLYPRLHVLPRSESDKERYPNGKVFCSGYGPETKLLNLDTWTWEAVDVLKFGVRHDGCSVLLPLSPPDYRARILTFGGSKEDSGLDAKATETAEIIDFGKTPPRWELTAPMKNRRVNACSVLMPDGKVMAVGGNSTGRFDDPVMDVEMYHPDTDEWTLVAPITVPRGYHCTAILLPDGRVLVSGTTPFGNYELKMEVYTPYYLYRVNRPVLDMAPEAVFYDERFAVKCHPLGEISKAVLLRPGAVTHAFDMDARYVELEIAKAERGILSLVAPRDEHVAPPGSYMLFLLNDQGIPSEARFIRLRSERGS